MYSMWKIMCFFNLKPHKHIALHQIQKIMFFLATSYDHFNYFTFPKRSWGEVTSFIPTGAKCIDVFDLKQHRADDQRMTSKYRESDSKVCSL